MPGEAHTSLLPSQWNSSLLPLLPFCFVRLWNSEATAAVASAVNDCGHDDADDDDNDDDGGNDDEDDDDDDDHDDYDDDDDDVIIVIFFALIIIVVVIVFVNVSRCITRIVIM